MKNDQYFKLLACMMVNDQVISLTEELGIEGFGAFVSLLIELCQRDDYRCAIRSLSAIARRLNTTRELLLQVVCRFGLFRVDEDTQLFSSPYLDEVMGSLETRRNKQAINRENGLKGGRPPKSPKEMEELTGKAMGNSHLVFAQELVEESADKSTEEPVEKPMEKFAEKPNLEPAEKPNSKPSREE